MPRSYPSTLVWALAALCAVPASLCPQNPPGAGGGSSNPVVTFRADASFVRLDVQVLDHDHLITDLNRDDFLVYDEGRPQPLSYFGRESEPLTLLLLLDVSGSVSNHLDQIAANAQEALRFLRPGDRVGVMVFARATRIREPFSADFAEVAREIRESVHDESVGSSTLINSAVLDAAAYMRTLDGESGQPGRRSILIVTDNFSVSYRIPDEQVVRALESANTVLNAIVVAKGHKPAPPPADRPVNPDLTPADVFLLADQTGGEAVEADRPDAVFRDLIERIRTRYTLQYRAPRNVQPGYRRVRVLLADAARRRYPHPEIRSRRGYLAG